MKYLKLTGWNMVEEYGIKFWQVSREVRRCQY